MLESESQEILYSSDDINVNKGCGSSLPCDPKRRLHRYLILIPICLLSFGSYFCYDNPAALEDKFMRDLSLSGSDYMQLYAFYSWPNVILSFVGGFLIDRVFGIRLGAIIFSAFVLVGQVIFALGAYTHHYWLCLMGRFIFGIGGESLAVAQNTYASSWFDDSELNFIFGLQLSMSRIGSTVNLNTMEKIYDSFNDPNKRLGLSLFVALSTCIFSFLCALVVGYYDKRKERIFRKDTEKDKNEIEETIKVKDIIHFPAALWLVCGICVAYYSAVFPFVSLAKVFFMHKYSLSGNIAALYNSLIYIISPAVSPITGFLIDFMGFNIFWVATGTLATLGCHVLFGFTWVPPVLVTVLLGIAYSILASALWPMVALILPAHQRGTGFGIMQSIQNLGLGVIGIIAGVMQDKFGFLVMIIFFAVCLCLTFLLVVILYFWDVQNGGKLNESGSNRRKKMEEKEFTVSQTVDT